jgi:hypothetical protein
MSNASPKNLTKFWQINRTLKGFLHKKRPKNHLEVYLQSNNVKAFEKRVLQALLMQFKQIKGETIRRAVESRQKVTQEEVNRVRAVIDEDWGSFDEFLDETGIREFLAGVYNDAGNQVMENLGIQGTFDLQNQGVLDKLRDRTLYLIRTVDNTTREDLATMISEGVENNLSWQEIASQISDDYEGEIAPYRAELISRMETDNAYNMATADFFEKNGIQTKVWVTADNACDECQGNEDEGSINFDESFSSGDDEPPAHVNCQCVLDTQEELPVDYEPDWTGQ